MEVMVLQHCEFILSVSELYTQKWLRSALTTLGLSCGIQAPGCGMRDLVPWPGVKPPEPCIGRVES